MLSDTLKQLLLSLCTLTFSVVQSQVPAAAMTSETSPTNGAVPRKFITQFKTIFFFAPHSILVPVNSRPMREEVEQEVPMDEEAGIAATTPAASPSAVPPAVTKPGWCVFSLS